jgi:hypothetical protein
VFDGAVKGFFFTNQLNQENITWTVASVIVKLDIKKINMVADIIAGRQYEKVLL